MPDWVTLSNPRTERARWRCKNCGRKTTTADRDETPGPCRCEDDGGKA